MTDTLTIALENFEQFMDDNATCRLLNAWEDIDDPALRAEALSILEKILENGNPANSSYVLGRITLV